MGEIDRTEVLVPGRLQRPPGITIVSFGYQHGAPPEAEVLLDVRRFARDLGPGLRNMTAEDIPVQDILSRDFDVRDLCHFLETITLRYSYQGDVTIAVGCHDGRQLSPVIAVELRILLGYEGNSCTVYDRDIHRPAATIKAEVI